MIISTHTHTHTHTHMRAHTVYTQDEEKTAGSIQSINIVVQSVTVTEAETVTVLKSRLQKPICLVLTVHKQFFLYPARERERDTDRERERERWRGRGSAF